MPLHAPFSLQRVPPVGVPHARPLTAQIVREAIRWRGGVDPSAIRIHTAGDTVTLSGHVPTADAVRSAEAAVQALVGVPGIGQVLSLIRVQGA